MLSGGFFVDSFRGCPLEIGSGQVHLVLSWQKASFGSAPEWFVLAIDAGVIHIYEQLQIATDGAVTNFHLAAVLVFEEADGFLKREGHSEIGKGIDQQENAAELVVGSFHSVAQKETLLSCSRCAVLTQYQMSSIKRGSPYLPNGHRQ